MTRWHPARWSGEDDWIRVIDTGYLAVWMAPNNIPEGGVTIAMYSHDYFDDGTEVRWAMVPRGSDIPYEVMDKPHRIRWAKVQAHEVDCTDYFCTHALATGGWPMGPSHFGHRRLNYKRPVWKMHLPRKLRAALQRPLPRLRPTKAMRHVLVSHTPVWEPADLRIDSQGNTSPGFVCVHALENGHGLCDSTTFDQSATYSHYCYVSTQSSRDARKKF